MPTQYDLVIRNGTIYDGTGGPPAAGDLAVNGQTIAAVGALPGARGRTDVPKIVDWYMDGKIEIDSMITHILTLDDINTGFDLMHAGKSIRAVLVY